MDNGEVLRVGLLNAVSRLDPQDSFDQAGVFVHWQLYEAPFELRRRGPVPVLFEDDLETVAPGTIRGRVREDVLLSDGSNLDAPAMLAALNRSRSLTESAVMRVEGESIVFQTETTAEDLAMELTKLWSMIAVPRGSRLVGTGPFMVAPDATPDRQRLLRNPHHRRHPAHFPELIFESFPPDPEGRPTALVDALQAGKIDLACGLSRDAVADVTGVRRLVLRGNSTAVLWFNTDRLPDRDTRQALCACLDRESIASLSYPNAGSMVARSVLPPRSSRFDDGHRSEPRRAREQLAKVRLSQPLRMVVIWAPRPYMPHPRAWAKRIAREFGKAGVEVEIVNTRDPDHYQSLLKSGSYDMVLGGWNADTEDPADFVEALFWSANVPRPGDSMVGGCNYSRWSDANTDELLARYRRERSAEALDDLLRLVRRESVAFPVACGEVVLVHRERVTGLEADACGVPHLWNASLRDDAS